MYMMINYKNDGCKTLLSFASSSERDACLLFCLKSKPGYLKSLMKKTIATLLLPAPCHYFSMFILSPRHAACRLKIFVHSGGFLGKEFKKRNKTLKADWLLQVFSFFF